MYTYHNMHKIVLGTMNIYYPHSSNTHQQQNQEEDGEYLSILNTYCQSVGEKHAMLDTAYYYGNTKTEQKLGELLPLLPFVPKIATKVNPWLDNDFSSGLLGQLARTPMLHQFNTSLKNLQVDQVDILYLHCPDYTTHIYDTLKTIDELWRKEKINNWGLSNYSLLQSQQILDICEIYKYQLPKYYQGMYNIISRKVEEIFPLLEENDIEFWGYNPLAGGLLTGKYHNFQRNELSNNRFHNNSIYQNIFWKPEIMENLEMYFPYKTDTALHASYSWLQNHSFIKNNNNKIVLGVSTESQLNENLSHINNGITLDENELVKLDILYDNIRIVSPNYYY